jgi:hypothetical protein
VTQPTNNHKEERTTVFPIAIIDAAQGHVLLVVLNLGISAIVALGILRRERQV